MPSAVPYLLFFCALTFFFGYYGDRGSISSEPVYHLSEILFSPFFPRIQLYRYAWEPLSWEMSRWLFHRLGHVHFMWYLPHVFGAAAVTLLVRALRIVSGRRLGFFAAAALVFLFPELIWSGLYYNSSVLAFAGFMLALNLLLRDDRSPEVRLSDCLAGAAAAAGCFFRFDFAAVLPLLVWTGFGCRGQAPLRGRVIPFAAGFVTAAALGAEAGLIQPFWFRYELFAHAGHIRARGGAETRPEMLFSITSLPVWVLLAAAAAIFLRRGRPGKAGKAVLLFTLIPLGVVIALLTTPKYLLPYIVFLPLLPAAAAARLQEEGRTRAAAIVTAGWSLWAVLVWFLALVPVRGFPLFRFTTDPVRIVTADGNRFYGAYRAMLDERRAGWERLPPLSPLRLTHRIAASIEAGGGPAGVFLRDRRGEEENWKRADKSWMIERMMGQIAIELERRGYRMTAHDPWDRVMLKGRGGTVRIERVMEGEPLPVMPEGNLVMVLPYGFGWEAEASRQVFQQLKRGMRETERGESGE